MFKNKQLAIKIFLLLVVFTFVCPSIQAKGNEYQAIVRHLKSKYQAKKVNIPFMWLARAAVRVVHPAGVKSISVTLFENLQFSRDSLDTEMQMAMRNSFSKEWSPIFHVRSRDGQQVYMYMRDDGKDVRMTLVTIDNNQAAVIRAKLNPEKMADFINDPKIFGISLSDNDTEAANKEEKAKEESKPEATPESQLKNTHVKQ